MQGVRPWQIVVMALAVLAVCGSAFYSCSRGDGPPEQANYARMVDIQTGELFEARYPEKRPVMYPATNPSTGTATLYPVFKKADIWALDTRYMARVKAEKSLKAELVADPKTGEVRVTNPSPTRADIFGK